MRDLVKDWRKWTSAERVASVVIALALLVAAPALAATHLGAHAAAQGGGISEFRS